MSAIHFAFDAKFVDENESCSAKRKFLHLHPSNIHHHYQRYIISRNADQTIIKTLNSFKSTHKFYFNQFIDL